MNDNKRNFIIELEKLSRKHKVKIWGCACCGSPSVEDMGEGEDGDTSGYAYEDCLEWVWESDSYAWENLGSKIVGKEK